MIFHIFLMWLCTQYYITCLRVSLADRTRSAQAFKLFVYLTLAVRTPWRHDKKRLLSCVKLGPIQPYNSRPPSPDWICYTVAFLSYLKWAQLKHTYLVACICKYGSDKPESCLSWRKHGYSGYSAASANKDLVFFGRFIVREGLTLYVLPLCPTFSPRTVRCTLDGAPPKAQLEPGYSDLFRTPQYFFGGIMTSRWSLMWLWMLLDSFEREWILRCQWESSIVKPI